MAGSGSFARKEQPRSVADPLDEPYRRMIAQEHAKQGVQGGEADKPGDPPHRQVDHPGVLESMVPIWGSGKEALADLEDKDYAGAALNGALAVSDVFLAKAVVSGLAKGGLKMSGPWVWRQFEKRQAKGMRPWLGDKGFLKPGQPGHHWLLEQKGTAPDWLRNQPPFIKPMKDAVEHGRIHGPYTVNGVKLPQYNQAERLWYGTPGWVKAGSVSTAGHAGEATGRAVSGGRSPAKPGR